MKVLYSLKNAASVNMGSYIVNEYGINAEAYEGNVLDVECVGEDMLVLSPHKSKLPEKIFTVHFTGNWGKALFGGKDRTLSFAYGSFSKALLKELSKNTLGWKVSLEADHHGPTCDHVVVFLEIGSTESEWRDVKAAREAVDALMRVWDDFDECECFFGVGGGHYPYFFNDFILQTPYAVGHIAPKYVLNNFDKDLFEQALKKNVEKVEKVFVVKKETNSSHKKKIRSFCSDFGVEYVEG